MQGLNFNINGDPLLSRFDNNIDAQIDYLNKIKAQQQNIPQQQEISIWSKVDAELESLSDKQREILMSSDVYLDIQNQLTTLVQLEIVNVVKGTIEQSEQGKSILIKQLEFIRANKDAIIKESNKGVELFEKFQIASSSNPSLTYAEFIKNLKQ